MLKGTGGRDGEGLQPSPLPARQTEAWVSSQNPYWVLITWAWLRQTTGHMTKPSLQPQLLPNGQGFQGPKPPITELFFLVTSSHPEPLQGPHQGHSIVQQRHSVLRNFKGF